MRVESTSCCDASTFVGYRIFANRARVTQHLNWYGETDVLLRHLTPSTTYTFTVKALDQDDNASTSKAVTLTTESSGDVTPLSAPTNVRIVGSNGCPEFLSPGPSSPTTPIRSTRSSTRSTSTVF